MSSSSSCGAEDTINLLKLLTENIVQSASFNEDVIESATHLIEHIKKVIVKNISRAIVEKNFFQNTETFQTALGVYNFDSEIFTEIFDKVLKNVVRQTSFEVVLSSLANIKDIGPAVDAHCALLKYIHIDIMTRNDSNIKCALEKLFEQSNYCPLVVGKFKTIIDNKLAKYTISHFYTSGLVARAFLCDILMYATGLPVFDQNTRDQVYKSIMPKIRDM